MIITAAGFIDIDFDPIGVDLKHGTGGAELAPGGCAKIAFMQPDFGFDEVTIASIRQTIPVHEELVKMSREGKSDEEMFQYLRQVMRRRADGGRMQ